MMGGYAQKLSIAMMVIGVIGLFEYFGKPGQSLSIPLILFAVGLAGFMILRKNRE
ncbi:MAG: hypothetical protein Q8K23_05945 [Sulfuritalea sp.]|nr:hypothetical protein [Sulfuritalea sp.]